MSLITVIDYIIKFDLDKYILQENIWHASDSKKKITKVRNNLTKKMKRIRDKTEESPKKAPTLPIPKIQIPMKKKVML